MATIELYKKQLEGLTLTQQKLAMATAGLTTEQQKYILSKIEGTAVVGKATAVSLAEILVKQRDLLTDLGVITGNEAETGSEIVLTKAKYDDIMASELLNEVKKKEILTSFGVADANTKQASSYGLLKGSMKSFIQVIKEAWDATEGMGGSLARVGGTMKGLWSQLPKMGKIGIIAALVVGINEFTKLFYDTTEDIEASIEDAKSKISETENEISSLESQIGETIEQIERLKEAGANESTITTYERENELLEEQKRILEEIIAEQKEYIAVQSSKIVNNEGSSSRLNNMLTPLQNLDIMGSTMETPIVGGLLGMFTKPNGFENGGYWKDFEVGGFKYGMQSLVLDTDAFGLSPAPGLLPLINTLVPREDPSNDIVSETTRLSKKYIETKKKYDNATGKQKEELGKLLGQISGSVNEYAAQLIEHRKALVEGNVDGIYDNEIKKIDDALKEYYKSRPDIAFKVVFGGGDGDISDIGNKIYTEYANGGNVADLEKIISSEIKIGDELYNELVKYGIIYENDKNWESSAANKFIEYFSKEDLDTEVWKDLTKETTASISELSKASKKISSLQKSFDEITEEGYITTDTIAELKEATGLSGEEWDNYEQKLLKVKAGSTEFNQIMSELTYKILDNAFAGKDLTEITEAQVVAILRENGVVNASAVAYDWLRQAKAKKALVDKDSVKIMAWSKELLESEATACNLTAEAYASLLAEEILFGDNDLNIDSKIYKINQLAGALGLAGINYEILNEEIDEMSGDEKQKFVQDHGDKYKYLKPTEVDDNTKNIIMGMDAYEDFGLKPTTLPINFDFYGYKSSFAENLKGSNSELYVNVNGEYVDFNTYYKTKIAEDKVREFNELVNNGITTPKFAPSSSDSSKNSYEDLYDEFLETLEQEVENFDDSISRTNTKLEHAIKTGNAEQINILSKEMDSAYAQKKALLESKANEARTQLALIMEEIYAIAPQLSGKSINEITPFEIESISMSLGDGSDKWDSITKSAQNYYETINKWSDEWWKNEDARLDSEKSYYDTVLSAVDRYAERIEYHYQQQIDVLDDQITKEEALLKIKESQFEATNSLKEAQKEIDKEIQNSRNSKQYLSKREYERIFNEEDYEKLSEDIANIGGEINTLTDDFYKQVEDAYKNGQLYLVETITAEYERQLAMKERELEIAKANVDLEKKRLNLENTLAEKNIKQYSENGITWVADQEKVKQAQEEFLDAQAELKDLQEKNEQQMMLDQRQANIDMLTMQKSSFEHQIDLLNKSTEKLKLAVEDITDPFVNLADIMEEFYKKVDGLVEDAAREVTKNVKDSGVNYGAPTSSGNTSSSGVASGKGDSSGGGKTNTDAGRPAGTGVIPNSSSSSNHSSDIVIINGEYYDRSQTDENGYAVKIDPNDVYDSGGIASGKGLMLKDVNEEETVLPPWLTKQILTPEYNENFKNLLDNMQMVSQFSISDFIVSPQTSQLPFRNIAQTSNISKTWTGNMYVDGGDPNEVLRALEQALDHINI